MMEKSFSSRTRKLENRVERFILDNEMISRGDRVLVGVSGGADSMCLLFLLQKFAPKLDFTLSVIHVEHGIRGEESIRDAEYVEKECFKLGVPFRVEHINAIELGAMRGKGVEEAAREARYEIFESEDADKIATAHHGDDSAETFLFQLVRGSSLAGLSGIPPVRGRIIRPLLCLNRQEIEGYCRDLNIDFRTDSTNLEDDYTRNRIRNRVLPLLSEINAAAKTHIAEAAADVREAQEFFEAYAERLFREFGKKTGEGRAELPLSAFDGKSEIVRRALVFRALKEMEAPLRDIGRSHVEAVLSLALGETGKTACLPNRVTVKKEYGKLVFSRGSCQSEDEASSFNERVEIPVEGQIRLSNGMVIKTEVLDWKEAVDKDADLKRRAFQNKPYTKWMDYDKIKGTLILRKREPGDYIVIRRGRKKIKDLFTEERIEADKREALPLLALGKRIIWAIGLRISEDCKISERTERVFHITVHETGTMNKNRS